jgi:hypothetical protein
MPTRTELIAKVKEQGIKTERAPHMMKTTDLEALFTKKEKDGTLKARILELGKEGKTKHEIVDQCVAEGMTGRDGSEVRYVYVHIVLKNAGIEVPKEIRKSVNLDK